MGWGPSRVRDVSFPFRLRTAPATDLPIIPQEFLFYHQRENEVHEDPNNPSARWASMMRYAYIHPSAMSPVDLTVCSSRSF